MTADSVPPSTSRNDFPPPQFPTVFADTVGSLTNSPTIVKFFLARFEPSFSGDGKSQIQPFAQVVMPMDGFAAMFVFFEAQLKIMMEGGFITEFQLSELRAVFSQGSKA